MADIRIDTSALTYRKFLIPAVTPAWIDGGTGAVLSLMPGDYGFQQVAGQSTFRFEVTQGGLIDYASDGDRFLSGRGTDTLVIRGFNVDIDGRALSHDLILIGAEGPVLTRDRIHTLALVPTAGYGFHPAAGVVGDFRFEVTVDGRLVVDPRFAGFSRVDGRALTIGGYRTTLDGRALSHDLIPLNLFGNSALLSRSSIHEMTYLPAAGYGFHPAAGVVGDFRFEVTVDGRLVVDPRFAGFTGVDDRALTINGYRVAIDGRDMPHDLIPSNLFGGVGVLSRERVNVLTLLPAAGYLLRTLGEPIVDYRFSVEMDGSIDFLDVPGGVIIMRPVPPPATLRSFYADLFLPPRGSVRSFTDEKATRLLRSAIRDHREGLLLGRVLKEEKLAIINSLFDGATSEEEEDMALGHLLGCTRADDLIFLVNKLTWDGLDDDLDENDLTRIMDRLKVLLDRRNYLVGFLLRWFFLVDDNTVLPTLDFVNILTPFAASRSVEVRHSFADQALSQRDAVRDGLAHVALRHLPTHAREFRLALDSVAGPERYRAADLQALSWEVFYTDQICSELARGEYRLLQQSLPDLVNPNPPQFPARNIALFNMLRRWDRHFVAMDRAIALLGSERQKADCRRYMDTRRLFMDNFPALQPPPPPAPPAAFLAAIQQAIQSIQTTLTGVAGTFQDLVSTVGGLAATIETISAPQLLETADDDKAVQVTNTLSGEGLLALLPSVYKSEMISKMISGACEDEEEQAILTILQESKTQSPAEFLQLSAGATWEMLDSNFNGSEYDQLEGLFKF
ncbi:hypothetical protein ACTMTF_24340 [Nonomuraea sp. ZG12]|uniref:hypothetical protein n=1 Tax=Nonomuraea sp. ZG12 TaxID=3452207 RepID=UPI003F88F640